LQCSQIHQHSTYSFYARRSQKRKKDCYVFNLFTLSGSTSIKAARKTLVKLTVVLKFDFRQKSDPFQEEVSDLTIIAEYFCHHILEKIRLFKN